MKRLAQEQDNEERWKCAKECSQQKENIDRKKRDIDEMVKKQQARLKEVQNQTKKCKRR